MTHSEGQVTITQEEILVPGATIENLLKAFALYSQLSGLTTVTIYQVVMPYFLFVLLLGQTSSFAM